MAIPIMKKHKNIISSYKHELDNLSRGKSFSKIVSIKLPLEDDGFGLVIPYEMLLDVKIKVIEEKETVYIGIDLTPRCDLKDRVSYTRAMRDLNGMLYNVLYNIILIKSGTPYDEARRDIPYSKEELLRDAGLLTNTKVFERLYNCYNRVKEKSNSRMILRDDALPKLRDRTILPIIALDFKSNELRYWKYAKSKTMGGEELVGVPSREDLSRSLDVALLVLKDKFLASEVVYRGVNICSG